MESREKKLSRRNFFGTSGIAGLSLGTASAGSQAAQRISKRLAAGTAPEQLSDNLFRLEDTCNVYLIRDGNRGTLIDFGAGRILDYLPQLGVTQVDGILHTHHHRDQCQGDHLAAGREIPIAVPTYEHHLFTDVENFWRNRRVFHEGYETRNDYFTLSASVPVAARIPDYEIFRWGDRPFYVLPSPGHTLGSITLLTEVDGRKVAFIGDLMHSPGKVRTLHELQHFYGGNEGVDFTIFSLHRLRDEKPQLLCPSHGNPMADAKTALGETIAALSEYYRFATGLNPTVENVPFAISRHLVASDRTACNFYVIISDSGKAMFIDYGFPSGDFSEQFVKATAVNDRCRFVEHNLHALTSRFGLKAIDVAMPTHTNDDHYCGFPYLQRKYGTRVWCYESMVDILQNPRGNRLGCILAEPLHVDRSFRHGETFRWEEFEFTITHNPGHAEHQMALFVTIDGQRVAFTGDNYSIPADRPTSDGSMRIRPVFLNHFESDSYQKAIRTLIEHRPDLIAPGHGRPFPVTEQMLLVTKAKIDKRAEYYKNLIADPDCDFGLDATWVKIYPYQMVIAAGDSAPAQVRVHNYRSAPMKIEVAPVLPYGWRSEPEVLRFEAPPKGTVSCPFRLFTTRGGSVSAPRLAITADVTADGKRLGQIAEAVVNLRA
jgi:glyoxylase-like metal-dependent hydrolase (beta-lactamase superfamily II)